MSRGVWTRQADIRKLYLAFLELQRTLLAMLWPQGEGPQWMRVPAFRERL
jgi:hypothetical protein